MRISQIETLIDAKVLASVLYQVTEGREDTTNRLLNVLTLEELCEVVGILKQFLPEFITPKILLLYHTKTNKVLN